MRHMRLKRQLRQAAANKQEASELNSIASQLGNLPQKHLGAGAKARIAQEIGIAKPRHMLRYAAAGGFAALFIFTGFVQAAKPGSTLYALKRRGEDARALVQPGFKVELEQHRKTEDNQRDATENKQTDSGTKGSDDSTQHSISGDKTEIPDSSTSTSGDSKKSDPGSSSSDSSDSELLVPPTIHQDTSETIKITP